MNPSSISVIIPTHNRAELVCRAIRSALESCGAGDEIIVVDDGSNDGTKDALESFGDRIHYLLVPRGGAGKARNHGVRIARNPLVAFLDSDDEWVPGYLEAKRRLLKSRADVLFCFSDFASCLESGRIDHGGLSYWHRDPIDWDGMMGPGVLLSSLIELPSDIKDTQARIGNLYRHEMAGNYVLTSSLLVKK